VIFVDTGAWFALAVPWDPDHHRIRAWFRSNTQLVVTTDYVIDETLTLLRARGANSRALAVGADLIGGRLAAVHKVELPQVHEAWDVFSNYRDKDWSFTDCVSYVVMKSLAITTAVSLDRHFRQFGFLVVVP
jgi:predicted nucleic acid-binding protein